MRIKYLRNNPHVSSERSHDPFEILQNLEEYFSEDNLNLALREDSVVKALKRQRRLVRVFERVSCFTKSKSG